MEDSNLVLITGETWKRHATLANVYSEQLTYGVFRSISGRALPNNVKEAIVGSFVDKDFELVDGFSLKTGRFKIISSDSLLIFASPEG